MLIDSEELKKLIGSVFDQKSVLSMSEIDIKILIDFCVLMAETTILKDEINALLSKSV